VLNDSLPAIEAYFTRLFLYLFYIPYSVRLRKKRCYRTRLIN